MDIRLAQKNDLEAIMRLINQAKAYFKQNHIDQWQDGYPDEACISDDIAKQKSYVLTDQDRIIGTMYFAYENDPYYRHLISGQWLSDQPYGIVHRIVVDESIKGHGLAHQLLNYAEQQLLALNVHAIRMDTHRDNLSMQRFLTKNGFQYCGEITVRNNAPRIAFEKIL